MPWITNWNVSSVPDGMPAGQVSCAFRLPNELVARGTCVVYGQAWTVPPSALRALVDGVVAEEPEVVSRNRASYAGLLNALLGSIMKASRGKANPKTARALLLGTLGPAGG